MNQRLYQRMVFPKQTYTVITEQRVYQISTRNIKKLLSEMKELGHKVLSHHLVVDDA